jgi:hypothetical protein
MNNIKLFGVLLNKNAHIHIPKTYDISNDAITLLSSKVKTTMAVKDQTIYINSRLTNMLDIDFRTNIFLINVYNELMTIDKNQFNSRLSNWKIEYIPKCYKNKFYIHLNTSINKEYIRIIDKSLFENQKLPLRILDLNQYENDNQKQISSL